MDDEYLTRVVFHNCKMNGMTFINTIIHDVTIDNCLFKYTNFSYTSINNLEIIKSNMEDGRFLNVKCKNLLLSDDNLNNMEIIDSNLDNTDLSTCNIANIKFDVKSLKGIVIDSMQAGYLVGNLGVIIK